MEGGEIEGQNSGAPHADGGETDGYSFSPPLKWSFVADGELYVLEHPGATPIPYKVHFGGCDHPYRHGKQFKVPEVPPLPGPPLSDEMKQQRKLNHEAESRKQSVESAETALAYYNKKHHTDYKLVDALGSGGFLTGHIWYHTSFTAKPDNDDSSPKLFFAELQQVKKWPAPATVRCCRIVEGTKTKIGCLQCGPHLVHPTGGFIQGRYGTNGPRALRPRDRLLLRRKNTLLLPLRATASSSSSKATW